LTPAWQQILVFDSLTVGTVNRAREVHWCASGKVLNVALALHHLGAPSRVLTVVGGMPGEAIRQDLNRLGLSARLEEISTPTRVCTTLLEGVNRTTTELVENSQPLTSQEEEGFLAVFAEEAARVAIVILTGSLPEGLSKDFYHRLLKTYRGKAILDIRGPELLSALDDRPLLVKPNREELSRTLGRDLRQDADLFEAMRELNRRGAEWVVISDGKNPLYASGPDQLHRIGPPLRQVVNPIASGDCMAAGLAWALHRGLDPLAALPLGVAAAADNLGQLLPGRLDPRRVEELARSIEVTRITR
jgi:1-phosphofructokinase family hexose kinase